MNQWFVPLIEGTILPEDFRGDVLVVIQGRPYGCKELDGQPDPQMDRGYAGSLEIASLLLDHRANPNVATVLGFTPLARAVADNKQETARLLLDRGADPNCTDSQGQSPLSYDRPAFTEMLLQHGANVNARDS